MSEPLTIEQSELPDGSEVLVRIWSDGTGKVDWRQKRRHAWTLVRVFHVDGIEAAA